MINKQTAMSLPVGTILIDTNGKRWRVNGKNQRKTILKLPIKHGLYAYGYLTEENLNNVVEVLS